MTNSPLFSVLIAQYNNGKYLLEAIDSVRAQTYTNWEIIIVDDASTDNSKEIYSILTNDPQIKIYFNEENKGCGYTKHRCAELAKGELCGFLDPEDTIEQETLEVMCDEHLKYPEASIVSSRLRMFNEKWELLWESPISNNMTDNYLFTGEGRPVNFVSYKTDLYKKSAKINCSFKRAVDQYLYYILEEVGEKKAVNKFLYNYRINSNGISTGENEYKAFYWHIIAIKEAAERRGVSSEDVASIYINKVFGGLKNGKDQVLNSTEYKLGSFLMKPYKRLTRLFYKGK